jgi:MoxR-like ATPase
MSELSVKEISSACALLVEEVEKAIVGKRRTVELSVLTLLCNGHLLIEDIPGVGKTTLAKALAKSVGGEFRRIQFTPDLLPADITGSSIYNQSISKFEFVPGPIFGNIVLVDEINRATPKTQSALLEAMEERQVTTDGVSRDLPKPFFVVATQNTVEMTGTYPLPEAQLDRFLMRLSMGYPSKSDEIAMLKRQQSTIPVDSIQAIITPNQLIELQRAIREIFVHDTIREYIVEAVRLTRDSGQLLMGASPRGSIYVTRASQTHAAMNGYDYVRPDDVKAVAASVLGHRVIPRADVRSKEAVEAVIDGIFEMLPSPVPTAAV